LEEVSPRVVPGSARNWIAVNAVQQSSLNKEMNTKNMTTLHLRKSIGPATAGRAFLLMPLVLVCFALSPTARAVLPAPDGGYTGQNTAEGTDALFSLTTGSDNTAIGYQSLHDNTGGVQNTATGSFTLQLNTTGNNNTATGVGALQNNNADNNTATGFQALYSNTTGDSNTANGWQALVSNTTGIRNTATGYGALAGNTTGDRNTATGRAALPNNTTGARNTADGQDALFNNTTGNDNTANGHFALFSNTTGFLNTANGNFALTSNTTGNSNTANGQTALGNNTTGVNNIAVGSNAGVNLTTGGNNIDIGNGGNSGESNTIRIGTTGTQTNTFIAGIYRANVPKGLTVNIDSSGHLGTVSSSERFKDAIKPMDKASEAILALKPVTFHYKKELDPEGIPQFGLVAEEVEKVNPDLVARDDQGKIYTVRYEAVNAMLLNEFLKQHRKVEEQQATITQVKSMVAQQQKDFQSTLAQQQKEIKALTASLKEQALQIQKVSAQLEVSKPAPQVVLNKQE
jgi:hypothetical protein